MVTVNHCQVITSNVSTFPYGSTAQGNFTLASNNTVTFVITTDGTNTISNLIIDDVIIYSPFTASLTAGPHTYLIGCRTGNITHVTVFDSVSTVCVALSVGVLSGLEVTDCDYHSVSGKFVTTATASTALLGFLDKNEIYSFPDYTYTDGSITETPEGAIISTTAGTKYFTIDGYNGAGSPLGAVLLTGSGETLTAYCPPVVVDKKTDYTLLYVGIGVGVVVLIIILYFVLRKKPTPY